MATISNADLDKANMAVQVENTDLESKGATLTTLSPSQQKRLM